MPASNAAIAVSSQRHRNLLDLSAACQIITHHDISSASSTVTFLRTEKKLKIIAVGLQIDYPQVSFLKCFSIQ
jgi:hypothetical protein